MASVEDSPQLRGGLHWRRAVWALRCGYVELLVVIAGLVLVLSGVTAWVLAAGMFAWLLTAVTLATEFLVAQHEQADRRLGFWQMRKALLRRVRRHTFTVDPYRGG